MILCDDIADICKKNYRISWGSLYNPYKKYKILTMINENYLNKYNGAIFPYQGNINLYSFGTIFGFRTPFADVAFRILEKTHILKILQESIQLNSIIVFDFGIDTDKVENIIVDLNSIFVPMGLKFIKLHHSYYTQLYIAKSTIMTKCARKIPISLNIINTVQ